MPSNTDPTFSQQLPTADDFQKLQEALSDFTDGTPQDALARTIVGLTGLSEERCQEIAEIFKKYSLHR